MRSTWAFINIRFFLMILWGNYLLWEASLSISLVKRIHLILHKIFVQNFQGILTLFRRTRLEDIVWGRYCSWPCAFNRNPLLLPRIHPTVLEGITTRLNLQFLPTQHNWILWKGLLSICTQQFREVSTTKNYHKDS